MARQPRLVSECPNVENTILLAHFRAQYPARYSLPDDDKFVLHAGGSNYKVDIVQADPEQVVHVHPALQALTLSAVSLFVLNTSLILWVNDANVGVEVPYTLVALHALKEVDGCDVLYLQLLSSDVFRCEFSLSEYTQSVELVVRELPGDSQHFPVLTERYSLLQVYGALSTCSAFHYDSASDSEDELPQFEEGHQWITADTKNQPQIEIPSHWINAGVADDLGVEAAEDTEEEAGMNVNLGMGQIAGTVRRRNSKSDESRRVKKIYPHDAASAFGH